MGLLGFVLLAPLAGPQPIQDTASFPGSEVWKETWRDLDALERSAPASADRRRLAAELAAFQARHERSARKRRDRPEAFRSRVLLAHLLRLDGAPYRPVAEPGVPIAWLPGEAWTAAQVAGPGPTRVAAIEVALDEASPGDLGKRAELAFEVAASEARELHWEEAQQVARALHARVLTAPPADLPPDHRDGAKAATLLAFVSRMRGEHAEALAILEGRLGATAGSIERGRLLVELGRTRLAAGQDAPARRDLGEALALGSPEAGWLLGRSALSEGAFARARALLGALVSDPEEGGPPPPALRGYGLSLLTDAGRALPSTRNLPDPPR